MRKRGSSHAVGRSSMSPNRRRRVARLVIWLVAASALAAGSAHAALALI